MTDIEIPSWARDMMGITRRRALGRPPGAARWPLPARGQLQRVWLRRAVLVIINVRVAVAAFLSWDGEVTPRRWTRSHQTHPASTVAASTATRLPNTRRHERSRDR
jgi:hypothetical protein